MSDTAVTVPQIPPNIAEVDVGLVCINIEPSNGQCKTWAVMKKAEPLLPELTAPQKADITLAVLGVIFTAWLFVMLKRAI